jgi:hypothetical protein
MFCRSVFVLLSFFFWPFRCLSFDFISFITRVVKIGIVSSIDTYEKFADAKGVIKIRNSIVRQYNTIQYNTIQYNTIQYNTIQYNTIQYNTIQYNTIQYNRQTENDKKQTMIDKKNRFVDRCLSFFFWSLCCLFFDLRILITPLVSLNSSDRIRYSCSAETFVLTICWL